MAIAIGDCTIYDNKESETAALLGGDECEAPSTTVDASQSRAATTTATAAAAAAISTNKNCKPTVVAATTATTTNQAVAAKQQAVQEEVVNFDHLVNKEAHFDRRMLKLIEGKLQATRSATSFSK